jgi:hypothetical protein
MNATLDVREEFIRIVQAHHGVFLDAQWGFRSVKENIERSQQHMLRHPMGSPKTLEELDATELFVSDKDPAIHRVEHVATMGWFKRRNDKGGLNHIVLGNLIVVSIFSFWEDHYREKIASTLGLPKDDLLVPVLGDLRLIRNDIVHHQAIATARLEKCEKLRWFVEGDAVIMDEEKIDSLVVEVRGAIRGLPPPAA